jgi:hypothetical protein
MLASPTPALPLLLGVYKLVSSKDKKTSLPSATVHCLGIGDGVHRGLLDGVASRWVE